MITVNTLRALGASTLQCGLFEEEFPNGAELTFDSARRAAAAGLSIDGVAIAILNSAARDLYHELLAGPRGAHDEIIQAERSALAATVAEAQRAYDARIADLERAYLEALAAALAAPGEVGPQASLEAASRVHKQAVDEAGHIYLATTVEARRASVARQAGPRRTFALAKADALIVAGEIRGWRTA